MIRALPAPPAPLAIPWRTVALVLVAVPSIILSAVLIALLFLDGVPFDWWLMEHAARRLLDGTLYVWGADSPYMQPYTYRYSPLLAPVGLLSLELWRLLHLAVLALLPWRLALVTLAFAPFWFDVLHGNVMTFVFVTAYLAIIGNRWGTLAYFALCILVPRPLMIPVAVWIVWQRPEWRVPSLAFAGLFGLTLLYPGYLDALVTWEGVIMRGLVWPPIPVAVWLPIGLVLGAWLTWKGRLGLASLAISPYVIPYYLVMALLEVRRR